MVFVCTVFPSFLHRIGTKTGRTIQGTAGFSFIHGRLSAQLLFLLLRCLLRHFQLGALIGGVLYGLMKWLESLSGL